MAKNTSNYDIFVEHLQQSIEGDTFIKATLSKPRPQSSLSKITLSAFHDSSEQVAYAIDTFFGKQTKRTTIAQSDLLENLLSNLQTQMFAAHIQTTSADLLFEQTPQGTVRFKQRAPSLERSSKVPHNRQKQHLIPSSAAFLQHVGITSEHQTIRINRYDKYKQIQKYIEIVSNLLGDYSRKSDTLRIIDFGSGKNYLTFALHYHFSELFPSIDIIGVEQRETLIQHGAGIIDALALEGISFVHDSIRTYSVTNPSLVVALHACDTATDDAIIKAVQSKAEFICLAPCCHKYVRTRLTEADDLQSMLRHGIILERFCESLTDSLRVLTLEALGYKTMLFEFIAAEHTAKNTMITARRIGKRNQKSLDSLRALKKKFTITDFYLDRELQELL